MKLRNRMTGKVVDGGLILKTDDHDDPWYFDSIAELMEHWEDYKEPLIKDEKIRKAVRTWADANDITEINVASSGYELWGGIDDWCIHFGGNPFKDIKPLKYTIADLCGEEEEE